MAGIVIELEETAGGLYRVARTSLDAADNSQVEGRKVVRCGCSKTRCLKMYCECFRHGLHCGKDCDCAKNCLNTKGKEYIRSRQMRLIKLRNPGAFHSPPQSEGPRRVLAELPAADNILKRGCTCKKSGCVKRYCECFHNGEKCSALCSCQGCKNREEEVTRPRFFRGFTRGTTGERVRITSLAVDWM